MNYELIFFVIFLALTLIIGLWHGRDIISIKQYALGNRDFSIGALTATIIATWIGGDYLFITLAEVYKTGFEYALGCLGMVVCLLFNAYFVPFMKPYMGNLSVAETMGKIYGNEARLITTISGAIASAGFVALQFKVFSFVLADFLNFSSSLPIILTAFTVTIYSSFGGIKSVTFTDIFQFFTFGVVIPVMTAIIWYSYLNVDSYHMSEVFSSHNFNISNYFSFSGSKLWATITLFFMFAIPDINPVIFQRISMGSNVAQVRQAFIYAAILVGVILLFMSITSILLFAIDQNLNPEKLVQYIVANYANDSLKILIMVGLISMCLSSADSNINSASVMLTYDLCKSLNLKLKNELLTSKIFSFTIGLFALYLTTLEYDMLSLVFLTQSFYIPIIDVPLLLAIIGFKTEKRVMLIGMFASFISVIIWRSYFIVSTGIDSILPATLVNLIFFFSAHYLLKAKGGWKNDLNTNIDSNKSFRLVSLPSYIYHQIKTFDFRKFIIINGPQNNTIFVAFGIFCFISNICSMFSISNGILEPELRQSLVGIFEFSLTLSVLSALYPLWPNMLRQNSFLISLIWNIFLGYNLVYSASFLAFVSSLYYPQLIIFILNISVLAVITRWQIASCLFTIGLGLSLYAFKLYSAVYFIEFSFASSWTFFYSIMLSITIIFMFFKPKQEYIETTEKKATELGNENMSLNYKVSHYTKRVEDQEKEIERLGATAQRILNNVNHELRLPVGNVTNFAEMLGEGLEYYTKDQLKRLSDEVVKNSNRLSSMILNMLDLATLDAKKIELERVEINLSEIIEQRVVNAIKIYKADKSLDFKLNIDKEITVRADINYMRQVIDNLIINSIKFSNEGIIKITLRKDRAGVEFKIEDEGIGIPKKDIYDIFTPFKMGSNTESKAEGRGVGLALCKSAVEAHGGKILAESNGKKGACFTFWIPK